MAQPIKYNTSDITASCCIKKGNFDIGIIPNYAYGPTASTGFWAGYPPGTSIPTGGFISYENKVSQGPSIYSIANINEIVEYGKNLNIGTQSTPEDVIEACAVSNEYVFVNIDYPEIDVQGRRLLLDAGYTASYPWKNSTWYDISGNGGYNGNIVGTTTFVSGTSTYNYSDSSLAMNANAQNSMAFVTGFPTQLNTFTINIWISLNTGNDYDARQNIIGQQYSNDPGYTPQNDCNFLIRGNGTNGYQGLMRKNNINYTVNFGVVGVGSWKMLTLTYDGNFLDAYLDNNLVDSQPIGAGIAASNNLQTIIGGTTNALNSMGTPAYFDGRVGVVNIYDTVLSSGAIGDLYNNYKNQRNYI